MNDGLVFLSLQKYGYPAPFFVIAVIIAVAAPAIAALKSVLNTDGGKNTPPPGHWDI